MICISVVCDLLECISETLILFWFVISVQSVWNCTYVLISIHKIFKLETWQ